MESVIIRLMDENKLLLSQLEELKKKLVADDPYESPETKELATAFAKAQGEYPTIGQNKENPYFKSRYTDLDSLMKPIRPILAKYGLVFTQYTQIDPNGVTILHSKLKHSSGQWIETRSRIIPPKNDIQSYASTYSYQKRYNAMALLNLTTNDDISDDDGEVAMIEARDMIAKGPSVAYNPKKQSSETVTKEQLEEMEYELAEWPDIAEMILDKMQLQSLADMPKSQYIAAITRIREIKQLRSGLKK